MDMPRTGGKEDPVDGDGTQRTGTPFMTYDQKTGDGKWLTESIAILRHSIKENQAESTAKPEKTMRPVEGTDLSGLRPENCRR
jgi:hypothetical protein